jgi:hypothetical protein
MAVMLALFTVVMAGESGNAATQALAVVVRGLATGEIDKDDLPRVVLREFGLELPETTAIRVWDSSAEVRYIVLPMRPDGTEHLDEEGLADLVTRDCMVGVAVPQVTEGVAA